MTTTIQENQYFVYSIILLIIPIVFVISKNITNSKSNWISNNKQVLLEHKISDSEIISFNIIYFLTFLFSSGTFLNNDVKPTMGLGVILIILIFYFLHNMQNLKKVFSEYNRYFLVSYDKRDEYIKSVIVIISGVCTGYIFRWMGHQISYHYGILILLAFYYFTMSIISYGNYKNKKNRSNKKVTIHFFDGNCRLSEPVELIEISTDFIIINYRKTVKYINKSFVFQISYENEE